MKKILPAPNLNLMKHLSALSRSVGQLEKRMTPQLSLEWALELAALCEADAAAAKPGEYPLDRQFLLQVLTYKLKALMLKDEDWPDYFLRAAFRTELELSLWGNFLLFQANEYGTHKLVDYNITQFPKCLLPMDCVICNMDLGITQEDYTLFKQGPGRFRCGDCRARRSETRSLSKKEGRPACMIPYQTLPPKEWTRKVYKGMLALDRGLKVGLKEPETRDQVSLAVMDAYAFYLSQYAHRTYRPRYQVLHDYNHDWILPVLFYIALGEPVYLKIINTPVEVQPFQPRRSLDTRIVVEVPPIFSPEVESKPIAHLVHPEFIALQELDRYFIHPAIGNK